MSVGMQTVEDILEAARRLPPPERQRLKEEMEHLETEPAEGRSDAEGPYAGLLALAGTAHTDFDDVSTDKYKHLADIYADRHEDG